MKHFFTLLSALALLSMNAYAQDNRVWATFYGGTASEAGMSVVTDANGNVYLTGSTPSTTGIASGGHQNTYGGGTFDAFLVKFNSAGVRQWATYYGGTQADGGQTVAVDASGNIYFVGYSSSTTGIASGGYQNTLIGTRNQFLVKFDANGVRQWATYYGNGSEHHGGIALDSNGDIYLCSQTSSATNIASGGFQNTIGGGQDAYLVKFNSSGARLWATYYGGTGTETGYELAVDASGNVYMAGNTNSTSAIASGGFQNGNNGGEEVYLVKFNSAGNRLWATYYGGSGTESHPAIAKDNSGNIYLTATTTSASAIASGGFQNVYGGNGDHFLVKFDASGNRLWATYYGGSAGELVPGPGRHRYVRTDAAGNVFLCGTTQSTTAIASGGFQNSVNGGSEAFLVKFDAAGNRIGATYFGGGVNEFANGIAVDMNSNVYLCGETESTSGIAFGGHQMTHGGVYDAFLVKFTSYCTVPAQPSAITGISSLCNGTTNTYSVAAVAGATSYTWSLPGGWTGTSTTNSINATASTTGGNITVTADNTCGSSSAQTLVVTVSNPVLAVAPNAATCFGNCDGSITASTSGGIAPYSYSPSLTGLCAGSYTVTVTDNIGCSTAQSTTVTEPTVLAANATSAPGTVCAGDCAVLSAGSVTGGTAPYFYAWQPGNLIGSSINVCPTVPTCYTLTVVDANGCIATALTCVNVNSHPVVSYNETQTLTCINWNPITLTAGSPAGGVYSGTGVTGNTFSSATAGAGTFDVVYSYTDANGCSNSDTSAITVDLCTGVAASIEQNKIEAFPNPFLDKLTLQCHASLLNSELRIYDLLGQEVFASRITKERFEIDVNVLPPGAYLVKISGDAGTFTKQIIKQ
jgi:hypothetical protein